MASLTDLRGRVARCDASMAKLAADLKLCYDTTKSATQSHQDFSNRTTDHIQRLEAKVNIRNEVSMGYDNGEYMCF